MARFKDRRDAGRQLGTALAQLGLADPVVLALPRGGIPIGQEIAIVLGCPLEPVLVRKLGAPGHAELAIGAIVDGDPPGVVRNEDVINGLRVSEAHIAAEIERQLIELRRRRRLYLGERPHVSVRDRNAIVTDDGIATGATMRAALRGVRQLAPASLVLAVPVAPPDSLEVLAHEVDRTVCLLSDPRLHAVGQYYADFTQVEDHEVVAILNTVTAA